MSPTAAFAIGAATSSFLTTPTTSARVAPRRPVYRTAQWRMVFMEPQPGDPGYKPLPPVPKGFGMTKSEPLGKKPDDDDEDDKKKGDSKKVTAQTKGKKGATKLPVIADSFEKGKRGLSLLKEDLFKTAPSAAGVGRQDVSAIMKPLPGEPGYKPAAYETVKVSSLGISPFPDDKNAVGKVGGIEAVKKAAVDVKKGVSAKEIKNKVLKIEKKKEPEVYDIPDYLKPLPEDTPRRGYTWKNYVGR